VSELIYSVRPSASFTLYILILIYEKILYSISFTRVMKYLAKLGYIMQDWAPNSLHF
jgi:hypothetical protein